MSSVGLPGGLSASVDDDDIDGVPLQPLPSTTTAWLPQPFTHPPAAFIPASLPAIPSIPVINPAKAALFNSGIAPVLSVNRLEQERAAAEDKKRRQDEEAKAVYADFVASFAVNEQQQQQQAQQRAKPAKSPFTAFVRGGTIGGDNTAPAPAPAAANSNQTKRADPPAPTSASTTAVEPPWKRRRPLSPPPPAAATLEPAFPPPTAPAGRGKTRNIDLFLAELKQRQADPQTVREEVQPVVPATTNVFIAGLPLTTTESDLADEMVRFGDIASVKLLYPRTDEERARPTMNGFVAYMLRREAEDAMRRSAVSPLPAADSVLTSESAGCPTERREMNGVAWRGHPLKLHWSKPVTLPQTPVATKANRRATTTNQFVVQIPSDPAHRSLIDQLALHVSHQPHDYEQSLLEQYSAARTDPTHPYHFLYAIDAPDNVYYRWRVYSLRGGTGGLERWDVRPFQMIPHGPTWLPPVDAINVRVDEERRGAAEEAGLTSDEVVELQRLLSSLTLQRPSILAAMGWCMERAAAAAFIVRSISTALLSSSTDSCRRVSLLYLLSDLLYNSSSPVRNASLFRREATQPNTLHTVWSTFSPQHNVTKRHRDADQQPGGVELSEQRQRVGRKEREVVLSVLRTWQTWSLFEDGKIEQWMMSVRGLQATATALAAAQSPPVPARASSTDVDDVDGVPL